MNNNTDSGNTVGRTNSEPDKTRGKFRQPLTIEQRKRYLQSNKRFPKKIRRCLQDEWTESDLENCADVTRTDAVRETIYKLAWLDDHNHLPWIRNLLLNSELVENWYGGQDEVNLFIETSRVEKDTHYSVYQEDIDDDSTYVDYPNSSSDRDTDSSSQANSESESDSNSETEQKVGRDRKAKTPFDERKKQFRQKFNRADL